MSKHKQDNSPIVPQREKIKDSITIKENFNLTENQKEIVAAALDKNVKMIIIDAPAGTAKTFTALLSSLILLKEKRVSEIVYIRSTIQAKDGETGFLTGGLDEKMHYYNIPIFDKLEELLNKEDINKLIKEKRIVTYPTGMLRGYNFNTKAVIGDEIQNFSFDSIYTVATRMGMFSKLFLLGDTTNQNDLGKASGFERFVNIFSDQESHDNGVRYFKLNTIDIVRSPFVKFVVEKVIKSKSAN